MRSGDTGDAYIFNLTRLLFCVLIGAAFVFFEEAHKYLLVEWKMPAICALAGVANAVFPVGRLLVIRKNAMVSVDVSLTLGSLLPAALLGVFGVYPVENVKKTKEREYVRKKEIPLYAQKRVVAHIYYGGMPVRGKLFADSGNNCFRR